jgi:Dolichyl-phosphate-mannose-protein mannosyltransferase
VTDLLSSRSDADNQRLDWRERWFSPERRREVRIGARRHWIFLAVLGVGALLRIVTQVAYRPALLFIDSYAYLDNLHALSPRHAQPIGYDIVLRPVLSLGNLATVAALQHLLGLGMGIAIYAVLVRLGSRRWVAALAAAPVLLDAYQLQIEQNILSEVLFQALVLAAVVLLLWKRRPLSVPVLAVAGVLLGMAVAVRVVGLVLVVPAVAFALFAGPGGWQRLIRAGTIALAFALPVGAYVGYYRIDTGRIGINRGDALLLYGRAATIVDCRGLDLPKYERVLCPKEPLGDRLGSDIYAHHSPYPGRVVPPPGKNRDTVLRDFARRVFVHQPLDYARAVAIDFSKGFSWPRGTFPGDVPIEWWQFQRHYPTFQHDPVKAIRGQGGGGPSVTEPLAVFLRDYQLSVGYTPGPFLGLAFLAGVVAAIGIGRARRSGLRAACALPTLCGLFLLLGADMFHFSWRYQLPALVLAPLAGGLGLTALTGRVTANPATTNAPDSQPAAS